ncbi:hypothetical protein HZA42_03800 [Candidatus Peregrinibacteria bacterium]|nr:hypothetical protein [Candidatus Peregrinibacteria bacterium]
MVSGRILSPIAGMAKNNGFLVEEKQKGLFKPLSRPKVCPGIRIRNEILKMQHAWAEKTPVFVMLNLFQHLIRLAYRRDPEINSG